MSMVFMQRHMHVFMFMQLVCLVWFVFTLSHERCGFDGLTAGCDPSWRASRQSIALSVMHAASSEAVEVWLLPPLMCKASMFMFSCWFWCVRNCMVQFHQLHGRVAVCTCCHGQQLVLLWGCLCPHACVHGMHACMHACLAHARSAVTCAGGLLCRLAAGGLAMVKGAETPGSHTCLPFALSCTLDRRMPYAATHDAN
jgi:hypothetical protein